MSHEAEYEICYLDALGSLRFTGARVGTPYTEDGKRLCAVNGLSRTDKEIFLAAWGEDRAAEILRTFNGGGSSAPRRGPAEIA